MAIVHTRPPAPGTPPAMKIQQYYLACLSHASYMITDEKTKTAAGGEAPHAGVTTGNRPATRFCPPRPAHPGSAMRATILSTAAAGRSAWIGRHSTRAETSPATGSRAGAADGSVRYMGKAEISGWK